jgi:hypothetical protein
MATMRPTPRNELLGLLSDYMAGGLEYMRDPQRTQQMQGLAGLLESTGIPKTTERLAYGEPLTNIGRANVPLLKPETAEAIMTVAPTAKAAGAVGKRVARMAGQEITDVMSGMPSRSLLGAMTPQPKNILPPKQFRGKALEGLPSKVEVGGRIEEFGTDQRLVDIAKGITEKKGLIYSPQLKYAEIDPNRAVRLANQYELMQNNPNDPKVKKAYDAMINETLDQYEALRKAGYEFNFMPEGGDIYGNPRNAINDIVMNKRLSVFPTEQGFGGPSAAKALEANPLLMRIGEKWQGKDVTANDVFRAVHDVFGHAKYGTGFRAAGEENAFQAHARMYSPEALPAVASETRGQNSWVNFGPYGAQNRIANPALTEYAEQKTGIMEPWTWQEGLLNMK